MLCTTLFGGAGWAVLGARWLWGGEEEEKTGLASQGGTTTSTSAQEVVAVRRRTHHVLYRSTSQLLCARAASRLLLVLLLLCLLSCLFPTHSTRAESIQGLTGFSTTHFSRHTNKSICRLPIIINLFTFVFYHHYVA